MPSKYTPPQTGTWLQEKAKLANVLRLWEVGDWSALANVPDHQVNRNFDNRSECGVTVTFVKGKQTITLAMDDYAYPPTNLQIIRMCIDDMRMIERRGLDRTMQSAYLQLAAPAKARDWWEVLGVTQKATRDEVEAMFRVKARVAHPDAGGSDAAMAELNAAHEIALKSVVA